ncbi:hypothetical protein BDA96_10G011400 [Sorghum bicolor]|nr:hypothetical protein BDA96_10G011400 [Sorghum bicolor]
MTPAQTVCVTIQQASYRLLLAAAFTMAPGAIVDKDGVSTGKKFKEIAANILYRYQKKKADKGKAKGKEPVAEGTQPGVVILSATYTVAIEIGDGPGKRHQHIVQLVNGKGYPDASKDDTVSLIFINDPPAKVSDQKQMQDTIERLSTHLEGVKRILEDAAVGGPSNKVAQLR